MNGGPTVLTLNSRASRLALFLRKQAAIPFQYGSCDCALMPADWCESESGVDPAWPLRGQYSSDEEWQQLAEEAGGLVELWADLGRQSNLEQTMNPAVGDIGLVEIVDHGIFGAVKMTNRWAVKLERGITGSDRFKMMAAWRVPV